MQQAGQGTGCLLLSAGSMVPRLFLVYLVAPPLFLPCPTPAILPFFVRAHAASSRGARAHLGGARLLIADTRNFVSYTYACVIVHLLNFTRLRDTSLSLSASVLPALRIDQ
jgi:hypothetical protein